MRDRSEKTDVYLQGYAGALADLCREGQRDLALRMMRAAELTAADLAVAGVESCDLEELLEPEPAA